MINTYSSIKSRKSQHEIKAKLLCLPVWDALTLLPYTKTTSRLVDRALAAIEGDHE
jgi:hypothetical protein